jgi:UDP-glucose 4-epimerase
MGRGHSVTVIDNLSTSSQPVHASYFIRSNIVLYDDLDKLIAEHDIIYHLASSVGVELVDKRPSETLFNNVDMMTRLIPLFEKYQKKVIFASSSEIYGEGPFTEESPASIGPSSKLRWGYAASKLMMEFMFAASTFPYVIVRFFNVTGPGQLGDYGMVLPRFIKNATSNKPLIVYGDGSQVRSFCHINDAIDALLLVENEDREIYNIGSDNITSILYLAEKVIEITVSKSEVRFVPYEVAFSDQHGEIDCRYPNLTKLKALGYDPKYGLEDIIMDMTYEYTFPIRSSG